MGSGGHAPETAARILEGSRVTIRVPASDNTYQAPGVKRAHDSYDVGFRRLSRFGLGSVVGL